MPAFVRQHATRFLLFPALAMLLASCMSATPRPDAPPVVIKLIAFNDFHGYINPPTSPTRLQSANEGGRALVLSTVGIAYLSTLIAQLKAQNPLHAVVGAGDMIGGSPLVSTGSVPSDHEPRSTGGEHLGRAMYGTSLYARRSRHSDWSTEDLSRLRKLAATGTPLSAIASALRRTASAVRNKAGMHGISLRLPR